MQVKLDHDHHFSFFYWLDLRTPYTSAMQVQTPPLKGPMILGVYKMLCNLES